MGQAAHPVRGCRHRVRTALGLTGRRSRAGPRIESFEELDARARRWTADSDDRTLVPWNVLLRDGGPRVHPFCPILADGRLFAAIPLPSPKGWDLRQDPRCVIHAMPGADDDELPIRAIACEVSGDPSRRAAVREAVARTGVGGMIESVWCDPRFEFDLRQVDTARWVDIGRPGTHAVRSQWRAT